MGQLTYKEQKKNYSAKNYIAGIWACFVEKNAQSIKQKRQVKHDYILKFTLYLFITPGGLGLLNRVHKKSN